MNSEVITSEILPANTLKSISKLQVASLWDTFVLKIGKQTKRYYKSINMRIYLKTSRRYEIVMKKFSAMQINKMWQASK